MNKAPGQLTVLLERVAAGDTDAEQDLARLVYDELRDVAAGKLGELQNQSTLTPTVLVHEAYLRIIAQNGKTLHNRRHLFYTFAQAMWRIVAEHYRKKRLPIIGIDVNSIPADADTDPAIILDMDQALARLKWEYPREYEVAILRKALGFGIQETAELLDLSVATVKRNWEFARAYITRHLGEDWMPHDEPT
jgi:RNA polymerase sigma factor (TIGR02999 family)